MSLPRFFLALALVSLGPQVAECRDCWKTWCPMCAFNFGTPQVCASQGFIPQKNGRRQYVWVQVGAARAQAYVGVPAAQVVYRPAPAASAIPAARAAQPAIRPAPQAKPLPKATGSSTVESDGATRSGGYGPTPHAIVEQGVKFMGLKPGELLYELGAGDGRWVVEAAKNPAVQVLGFEIDGATAKEAASAAAHLPNALIQPGDATKYNLRPADVICFYLSDKEGTITRLGKKPYNARLIVSVNHDFSRQFKRPTKRLELKDEHGRAWDLYYWSSSTPAAPRRESYTVDELLQEAGWID